MENKGSLLNKSQVNIVEDKFIVRIPTVKEVLEDEHFYYSVISSLTTVPFQQMVMLDDMGVNDFTKVREYDLFKLVFMTYVGSDLSILFGDLDISDFAICIDKHGDQVLYSKKNDLEINEKVYYDLVEAIRKINSLEKAVGKPGNEAARKYLIEKERRRLNSKFKKEENFFEKMIVALVNTNEFPYDYDSCMDLSIYRFNQSFKQIQHKIVFDNTMIGVYAGTVDTKKLGNSDILSWIANK